MAIIGKEYSENETVGSGSCATGGEERGHEGLQTAGDPRWGPWTSGRSPETHVHTQGRVPVAHKLMSPEDIENI